MRESKQQQPYLTVNNHPEKNYCDNITFKGDFKEKDDLFENKDLVFERQITFHKGQWNYLHELLEVKPTIDIKFLIPHYTILIKFINNDRIELQFIAIGNIETTKKSLGIGEISALAKKHHFVHFIFSKKRIHPDTNTSYSKLIGNKVKENHLVNFDDIDDAMKKFESRETIRKESKNPKYSWLKSVNLDTAKAIFEDLGLTIQYPV